MLVYTTLDPMTTAHKFPSQLIKQLSEEKNRETAKRQRGTEEIHEAALKHQQLTAGKGGSGYDQSEEARAEAGGGGGGGVSLSRQKKLIREAKFVIFCSIIFKHLALAVIICHETSK